MSTEHYKQFTELFNLNNNNFWMFNIKFSLVKKKPTLLQRLSLNDKLIDKIEIENSECFRDNSLTKEQKLEEGWVPTREPKPSPGKP